MIAPPPLFNILIMPSAESSVWDIAFPKTVNSSAPTFSELAGPQIPPPLSIEAEGWRILVQPDSAVSVLQGHFILKESRIC